MLRDLSFLGAPDFYNVWAPRTGLKPIDTDWMEPFAKSLGYESMADALVHEHSRMYDELMRAYGKDELSET